MPARRRCICQTRLLIAAVACWIQLKRAGLGFWKSLRGLGRSIAWPFVVIGRGLVWLLNVPFTVLARIWATLWQLDEASSESFSMRESWQTLKKASRATALQVRRAAVRARRAAKKETAWTLAGVTGTLGILLMLILQLIYSFRTLTAEEIPPREPANRPAAKTWIDPGLPQVRTVETDPIPQIDPFAPAQPAPVPMPAQEPEFVDPLDNLPPLDPPRSDFEPPPAEEPEFVDPLNNLPPLDPPRNDFEPPPAQEPEFVDPLDNLPPLDSPRNDFEPMPSVEPVGDPLTPVPLPMQAPEFPVTPDPESQPEPQFEPPPDSAKPEFVDPLDNLPPLETVPAQPQGEPEESKPNPFVDPLDNLPPREPSPQPVPMPESVEPDLSLSIQRLPADEEERFVLESTVQLRRAILAQDVQFDAWDRYVERFQQERQLRSYWDRVSDAERERLEQDLLSVRTTENGSTAGKKTAGELMIDVKKNLPPRVAAFEPVRYEILVVNRGEEMIESVDVDEAVPPTHELTDAEPAGYFENNLLRWQLEQLRPGEERRLTVEVVPSTAGTIETTTSVRPIAKVASLTEVGKSASIRLRRSGFRTISLQEQVWFTNHVQNQSKDAQRDLEIVEQVPAGFRVLRVQPEGRFDEDAGTITWKIPSLPGGATVKLGVLLQAETNGELISRVRCTSREGQATPILARVYAGRSEARRSTFRPATLAAEVASRDCCGLNCR